MQAKRLLGSISIVLAILAAAPSFAAETESNIGIDQGQINAGEVETLLARVDGVRSNTPQRGELTMAEILAFLPATDDERATVIEAHPNPVPVSCSGDICTAVSHGSEVYVTLSQMGNIPAWFDSTITLKLRWRGPSTLELCSIQGMQVKKFFWMTVDGTYIDAHGADGSSFVDVGVGGSYPSC